MKAGSKWIPELLNRRYNQLHELRIAEDLQISLENSSITADIEKRFVDEKICILKEDLQASEKEALEIISKYAGDPQTWTFMRFRFICGYEWPEIGVALGLTEKTIKSRVYRAFQKADPEEKTH